ncbi:acyltransferase [Thiotrichales bacterium 19S3-7]|nr:acyltransferase [Thiotrichales bacterium 19S3-7]MCF6800689.1 acyltransferase [Thiotrichales bacterium 19S3-11]
MRYIKHIDGLRATAISLVLLLHLNIYPFSGGFVGVDIFFVISGFLISRIIILEVNETKKFNYLDFYYRRAKRILPALLFTLILTFIFGMLLLSANHFKHLGGTVAASALSFSNFIFWQENGYFALVAQFKPLLNTWSLGVEEQFYILWPLLLVLISLIARKKWLPLYIVLIGLISLSLNVVFGNTHPYAIYYLMPFRIFEFCIGALMVWVIKLKSNNLIRELLLIIAIILILYSAIVYNENTLFPSYYALLPCIGSAMVIYAGNANYLGKLFNNPLSKGLGLISYSLYLVHWPFIVLYSYYLSSPLTLIDKLTIAVICILLATLMFYFIETPFRKITPNVLKIKLKYFVYYLIVAVMVAFLGLSAYLSDGWLWRLSRSAKLIQTTTVGSDYNASHFGGGGFPNPGWTYNNGNSVAKIVLLGDSHAEMLQYGLYHLIAKAYNVSIYESGTGCLPLPGFTRIIPASWERTCQKTLNKAIKELKKSNDSILIVSDYWAVQISQAGKLVDNKALGINLDSDNYSDYRVLTSALEKLRKQIGNRKLIIIGDFPGTGVLSSFACLTRPALARSQCEKYLKQNLKYPNTELKQRINVNKILKKYANKHTSVIYIDPESILCPDGICQAIDANGLPIFSDQHHLSKEGSLYFISKIKPQLLKLLDNKAHSN